MATPSKAGKVLIEYNCKNGVYHMGGSSDTVKPLGYLNAVTTEKNINTKEIYGDGILALSVLTDKGGTGTLELTARDSDFEKDLGFLMDIAPGLAEVQIHSNKVINVGFECNFIGADGIEKTKKVWLLGVNVSPAGDSLSQNTDGTNESTASYGITLKGVDLLASDGSSIYTDENGNQYKVYKVSRKPSETGYATFLDSVPVIKMSATL